MGIKILHPLQLCGGTAAPMGALKQGAVAAVLRHTGFDRTKASMFLFCTEVLLLFLAFLGSISKVCLIGARKRVWPYVSSSFLLHE